MDAVIASLIAAFGTLVAAGGAYVTARRMGRLGLGPAQQRLNETLTDLNQAYEKRIDQLEAEVTTLQERNTALESEVATYRRENLRLRQDLDDLREEVRTLRRETAG